MARPKNETERHLAERVGIILCRCGGYLEQQTITAESLTTFVCTECGQKYTLPPHSSFS